MNIQDECLQVLRALHSAGVDYALCGGLAVAVHGCPRYTQDIDLLIQPDDLEATKRAVRAAGFCEDSNLIRRSDDDVVHRVQKSDGTDFLMLNLFLVTPNNSDVWNGRVELDLEGLPISVVSRQELITMKRAAGRPTDLTDILNLESDDFPEARPAE